MSRLSIVSFKKFYQNLKKNTSVDPRPGRVATLARTNTISGKIMKNYFLTWLL